MSFSSETKFRSIARSAVTTLSKRYEMVTCLTHGEGKELEGKEGGFFDAGGRGSGLGKAKRLGEGRDVLSWLIGAFNFFLHYTCLTDEAFLLIALHVVPAAGISERCHVNAITVIAIILGLFSIPVCVLSRTVVCPEKGPFQVNVIKTNPEFCLFFQKHSCQERLLIPTINADMLAQMEWEIYPTHNLMIQNL